MYQQQTLHQQFNSRRKSVRIYNSDGSKGWLRSDQVVRMVPKLSALKKVARHVVYERDCTKKGLRRQKLKVNK